MSVILRSDGFYSSEWNPDLKSLEEDLFDLTSVELPLLTHWNDDFEIDGTVLLADLVRLLRMMSAPLRKAIGKICNANIDAYIAPEETMALTPENEDDHLAFIEVYRVIDIDVEPDGKPKMRSGNSAHGILKVPGVDPVGCPYDSVAIEFTPWSQLISVPLRFRVKTRITKTFFRLQTEVRLQTEEDKKVSDFLSEIGAWSVEKWEEDEVEVSFSLGEFLTGIFDELCWFSSPSRRERERDKLMELHDELHERIDEAKKESSE
jgi:hypothetical protein